MNATIDDGRPLVIVIGGGRTSEHDVSRASASSILASLNRSRFRVDALTLSRTGRWSDPAGDHLTTAAAVARLQSADAVFPALHGPHGEDGEIAGFLETIGVPFVGASVRGGALAMDKWATKLIAAELGITTARSRLVSANDPFAKPLEIPLPVVVKPVAAGSSFGVSVVRCLDELGGAMATALEHDTSVLVEEFVVGREIDVAVVQRGDELLVGPPLEIVLDGGAVFDTEGKYDGSASFVLPADVEPSVEAALGAASRELFRALGCRDIARFDYFVTDDGLVLNEVNTMPGFTAQSQVPRMFEHAGLPYEALLTSLVENALERARLEA